jgi:hypothetical protein
MKFVVDRTKWICGADNIKTKKGKGVASLLNSQGFMCCLGHCCLQLGITKKSMLNKGSPIQVSMSNDRLKRVFLTVDGKKRQRIGQRRYKY